MLQSQKVAIIFLTKKKKYKYEWRSALYSIPVYITRLRNFLILLVHVCNTGMYQFMPKWNIARKDSMQFGVAY